MRVHVVLAGLDAAAGYFSLSRGLRPGWELLAVCASALMVGACGSAVFQPSQPKRLLPPSQGPLRRAKEGWRSRLAGKGGLWPLVGLLALPPAMLAGKVSVYFTSFAILWIFAAGGTLPRFAGRGLLRALQLMLGMTGQDRFLYALHGGTAFLPAVIMLLAVLLAELAEKASLKGASRLSVAGLVAGSTGVGVWATVGARGLAGRAVCGLGTAVVAAAGSAAVARFSPRAVMKLSGAVLVLTAAYDLSLILAGAA